MRDATPGLRQGDDLRTAAARVRAEWRADEEQWATAAHEQWRHTRTLLDVARDHLHRGDTIALRWAGAPAPVTGRVLEVAGDALALDTVGGQVHVPLGAGVPIAWRVVERAVHGGRRSGDPLTFRARLLELESAGAAVAVAAFDDEVLCGTLRVGRDHVEVAAADVTWVVALSAVRWVRVLAPG